MNKVLKRVDRTPCGDWVVTGLPLYTADFTILLNPEEASFIDRATATFQAAEMLIRQKLKEQGVDPDQPKPHDFNASPEK